MTRSVEKSIVKKSNENFFPDTHSNIKMHAKTTKLIDVLSTDGLNAITRTKVIGSEFIEDYFLPERQDYTKALEIMREMFRDAKDLAKKQKKMDGKMMYSNSTKLFGRNAFVKNTQKTMETEIVSSPQKTHLKKFMQSSIKRPMTTGSFSVKNFTKSPDKTNTLENKFLNHTLDPEQKIHSKNFFDKKFRKSSYGRCHVSNEKHGTQVKRISDSYVIEQKNSYNPKRNTEAYYDNQTSMNHDIQCCNKKMSNHHFSVKSDHGKSLR